MRQKLRLFRFHVVLSILAGAALVLANAGLAARQACESSINRDNQTTSGYIAFTAATRQVNCVGRTSHVGAWIESTQFDCSTQKVNGKCYDEKAGGNAVTTPSKRTCGEWSGGSSHAYSEGGQTTDMYLPEPLQYIVMNAGPCGEEDPPPDECPDGGEPPCLECGDQCTPIIIATGKNAAYNLTSVEDGVTFDIDGNGVPDQVSWTQADSDVAFLALDRNGDGQINSGKELFGNSTYPGSPNGFYSLRTANMETNGGKARGSVSSDDPLFAKLLLWTDTNHNGISEKYELRPASEVLSEIGLGYDVHKRRDGHGNLFKFRGWIYVRTDAGRNRPRDHIERSERIRDIYDVILVTK